MVLFVMVSQNAQVAYKTEFQRIKELLRLIGTSGVIWSNPMLKQGHPGQVAQTVSKWSNFLISFFSREEMKDKMMNKKLRNVFF